MEGYARSLQEAISLRMVPMRIYRYVSNPVLIYATLQRKVS